MFNPPASDYISLGDPDNPHPWTLAVQIPATLVHAIAILVTILRLLYRWRLSKFAWEDTWATLALLCDMGCLASIWMQVAPVVPHRIPQINIASNWLLSLTLTSIVWFARMSILSSIVRIANPAPKLRFVAYCIGVMFLATEAGLLAQKIYICIKHRCWAIISVAISQLVTDIISDTILVAAPIRFLRDVRLHRDRRILIISAFSASLLITGVTILHSVLLFQDTTNTTLIIGHVKAALALFVCNMLDLIIFVYRRCQRSELDLEHCMAQGPETGSDAAQFTSIIDPPSKFSSFIYPATSAVPNRGDAAYSKTLTPIMSARSALDPSSAESTAALGDAKDLSRDDKAENASHD